MCVFGVRTRSLGTKPFKGLVTDVPKCQGLPWKNGPVWTADYWLLERLEWGVETCVLAGVSLIAASPSFWHYKKGTVTWIPIVHRILFIQAECSSPLGTMGKCPLTRSKRPSTAFFSLILHVDPLGYRVITLPLLFTRRYIRYWYRSDHWVNYNLRSFLSSHSLTHFISL